MDLNTILATDAAHYMNTFGQRLPAAFSSGQGCTLTDTQGKCYIDFLSGIATNALGYAHPEYTAALKTQIDTGVLHTSNLFYNAPQAALAKRLNDAAGGGWRVFLGNSGAEANEAAVKLARLYFYRKNEPRYEIITAQNSFHGRTLAMVSATGQPKYQAPYQPIPAGFVHVPLGDLCALSDAITEKTCAIMLETLQGEGGVVELAPEYLQAVRKLCDDHGLLLILDEVQTGMGRTGSMFSFQQLGIVPDIFTLAKALGGGVPIGAVMAREAAAVFQPGDHGSTFGGNPLAASAALVVLDVMQRDQLPKQAFEKGAYFKAALLALRQKHPAAIVDVRGRGLLLGAELSPGISGAQIVREALNKGFLINCTAGNTLRFVPPLTIEYQQIDALIAMLDGLFSALDSSTI